ncbi:MAG: hypothetical protein ACK2UA_04920 [Anaerolineae bacterium]|jgi:hypothetical protein
MNATTWLVTTGLLFLLKLAAGYWLSRSGKPYNVGISTIHKIISLLAIASIALTVRSLRQGAGLTGAQIAALVVAGLLFLTAIGTGGVLSMDRPAPTIVSLVHKVTPYLALASTAVTICLVF